jgi:hypothetical protein
MFTEDDITTWADAMFTNDTILFYGPDQTYGLYKKLKGQVVHFAIPTREARIPSGRKVVARKVYTDFTGEPGLRFLSAVQFLEGINALDPHPEIYQANRSRRFRRVVRSVAELEG